MLAMNHVRQDKMRDHGNDIACRIVHFANTDVRSTLELWYVVGVIKKKKAPQ